MQPPSSGQPGGGGGGAAQRCTQCGNLGVDARLRDGFGVLACAACKRADAPLFELLPKTRAAAEFKLTPRDLAKLPSVQKENPRHASWNGMQLYLRLQLEAAAAAKHGSLAAVAEKKQQAVQAKLERQVADTQRKRKRERAAAGVDAADENEDGGGGGGGSAAGVTRRRIVDLSGGGWGGDAGGGWGCDAGGGSDARAAAAAPAPRQRRGAATAVPTGGAMHRHRFAADAGDAAGQPAARRRCLDCGMTIDDVEDL